VPADTARLGLYVHVPFCEAKCSYCHFAIDPRRPDDARQDRYLRALLSEMEAAPAGAADTLYFGGGTPSLFSVARLARIVELARRRFSLPEDAEITVEANPADLDAAGYRELRSAGVNRLSLGAQSFDDAVLREMGRLHSAADSVRAVARARAAGFADVSLDLILGWPGETAARWERNLEGVATIGPPHLSLYVLEVEGRTLLAHRARSGDLALPEDDLVAELYARTVDALSALGLERYEISNFARRGFESRHNAKYWADAPFLGFGMSAHSYRDGRRWWNVDTYGGYCRAVERHGPAAAVAGRRVLSSRERAQEALFTGLRRREGVDLVAFAAAHGVDVMSDYAAGLSGPLAVGLVERRGPRLRLTERGVLLSNEVFQAFV
jgi:putative oxygen-independent coproporphyrinogen III oxidase